MTETKTTLRARRLELPPTEVFYETPGIAEPSLAERIQESRLQCRPSAADLEGLREWAEGLAADVAEATD